MTGPANSDDSRQIEAVMQTYIEGSAASVRVELDNWTDHRFTDFFTLVKINGQWRIMSKVFFLHRE